VGSGLGDGFSRVFSNPLITRAKDGEGDSLYFVFEAFLN